MAVNALYTFLLSLTAAGIALALWKLYPILRRPYTTCLRNLPGPPSPSWLFGNLKQIWNAENPTVMQEEWIKEYGHTIMYRGFFNMGHLGPSTAGEFWPKSLARVSSSPKVNNIDNKWVPSICVKWIVHYLTNIVTIKRRILNPAFGPAQIRELTQIFVEKAIQLRDVWRSEINKQGKPARIEVRDWLSKMTLDVIGLAGFNYTFDALDTTKTPNDLTVAFQEMLGSATVSTYGILWFSFPLLQILPNKRARRVEHAQKVMRRIGKQLIAEKKAAVMKELARKKADSVVERQDLQGRDLLTLLIKANMASDIPENQRLPDEDVLAQVPTFLAAGHETSSTATTWCLFALTQAPEVQRKLREELFTIATDTPSMDELMSLPYLDAVVRETLRVHSPVPSVMRFATKDDVIPLNTPFVDRNGEVQDCIRISKGSSITIPILAVNRMKELWGDDSFEFKPERWESIPEAVSAMPGVWGHMLSFLGGPRSCIGYRFSLVEMKALVFTLVRAFEYELAVPPEEIVSTVVIVQRPFLRSEMHKGSQLPLLVKPHRRA
ncbi:hypothetical protein A0H81_13683 [Grifola frondosa]|uniref:Cytochrome P450 n=1 Tax=Grifola frondosa TaxID=5627 RepID=A0A1C7LNW1_GRIFR|nr:hypothetical protein A0H81_13683 [Grifola frondosa]